MSQQEAINKLFEQRDDHITMSQTHIRTEDDFRGVCQDIFSLVDDEDSSYSMTATFISKGALLISSHDCNFAGADDVLTAIVEARQERAIRINFDFSYPVEAVNGSITLEFVSGGIVVSSHREELDV